MAKTKLLFAFIVALLGSIFLGPGIIPVHAQTGTVCIIPNDATSCPSSPASITGTVGTQLSVSIFIQGSDHINGFDITLLANHTIIKPAGFDLNGSIIPGPQVVLTECLGGVLIKGNICPTTDTPDTLHLAVIACGGCGLSIATTGLLFHAIYNVTSASSGTSLSFQTGCSGTSHTPTCVTIVNGGASPVPENVQTATFSSGLASPTITTSLSATTIQVGHPVHDSAALHGATPNAGGSVTYTVFNNAVCSPTGTVVSTVVVTNGIVPDSNAVTFNIRGSFSWNAIYSGDANNNPATSACEPLTICDCPLTITTALSSTKINVGGSVSDQATLTAIGFQPTGTVTYLLYNNGVCNPPGSTVSVVTIANGAVPGSRSVRFNSTGSFSWNAVYSGDVNNNAATSACEPMSVVAPDFGLSANPSSLQIIAGSTGTSTITFTSLNGFNGTVSVSATPPPLCPSCSTWSVSPSSVTISSGTNATATLTISAGSSPISGNVTVFGMSGSLSHSVVVKFTVVTPDFTITASPSVQSVSRGSSTSFTITVKGTNGFNSTVTLSAIVSPVVKRGPTTSLPSTVGPYSTSTLTVSTTRNTPVGTYTITVTATSGSLTHTVTVTVTVTH